MRRGVASRAPGSSCVAVATAAGGGGGGAQRRVAYRGIAAARPAAGAELPPPRPERRPVTPRGASAAVGDVTFLYTCVPGRLPGDRRQSQRRAAHADRAQAGLRVLSVSVDPARDTPAAVRSTSATTSCCRRSAGCSAPSTSCGRCGGPTTSPSCPGEGDGAHSTVELLIDPTGRERLVYDANVKTADVIADLKTLEDE